MILKIHNKNGKFIGVFEDFACLPVTSSSQKELKLLAVEEVIRTINFMDKKPPKDYLNITIKQEKELSLNPKLLKEYKELFVQSCFSYKSLIDGEIVDNIMVNNLLTKVNSLFKEYNLPYLNGGFMEVMLSVLDIETPNIINLFAGLGYLITSSAKSVFENTKTLNPFYFE